MIPTPPDVDPAHGPLSPDLSVDRPVVVDATARAGIRQVSPVWWPRLFFLAFIIAALAVIWITNVLLTRQLTENTRNRAEVRQALYTGQILSRIAAHRRRAAAART